VTDNRRRILVLLVLAAVLSIDLWIFPLYETHLESQTVSVVALLSHPRVELGSLKAHRIFVSIDDIEQLSQSALAKQKSTALIISVFVANTGEGVRPFGALQASVLAKLAEFSPSDHFALVNKLSETHAIESVEVIDLELHVPEDRYSNFPVNHLLMVILPRYRPDPGDLQKGVQRALDLASRLRVSNVLVPCLATNWMKAEPGNALPFNVFFRELFDSLSLGSQPRNIYISLYSRWPSLVLEDAVFALNEEWGQETSTMNMTFPLYRRDLRLTIFFLALCLMVCSLWIQLTLKNVLVVAVSFVGLSLGVDKWVSLIAPPDRPSLQLIVQLIVLVVLSAGFPIVVRWNPKDLFGSKE